jgi:hypothetical protein
MLGPIHHNHRDVLRIDIGQRRIILDGEHFITNSAFTAYLRYDGLGLLAQVTSSSTDYLHADYLIWNYLPLRHLHIVARQDFLFSFLGPSNRLPVPCGV